MNLSSPWLRATGAAAAAALPVLAWTLPITTRMIADGDFPEHLRLATAVAASPHLPAPHFLFFVAVALVMTILPVSVQTAGIVVISLAHVGSAALIARYLARSAPAASLASLVTATTAVAIAGPVLPPFVQPDLFLMGYFPQSAYHNATFIVSKPFCLLLALTAADMFRATASSALPVRTIAAVVLTAIAKPNYLLSLVPAAVIQAWPRLPRRRTNVLGFLALVIATGLVALTMRVAYADGAVEVVVAPFAVLRLYAPLDVSLAGKLLAAVAFPLVVLLAWPRHAIRRPEVTLAWLAALIAVSQGYLLAEPGARLDHANLLAGGPQAVFVLLAVSAGALLSLPAASSVWQLALRAAAWLTLALHVAGAYRHAAVKVPSPLDGPLVVISLLVLAGLVAGAVRRPAADTAAVERA